MSAPGARIFWKSGGACPPRRLLLFYDRTHHFAGIGRRFAPVRGVRAAVGAQAGAEKDPVPGGLAGGHINFSVGLGDETLREQMFQSPGNRTDVLAHKIGQILPRKIDFDRASEVWGLTVQKTPRPDETADDPVVGGGLGALVDLVDLLVQTLDHIGSQLQKKPRMPIHPTQSHIPLDLEDHAVPVGHDISYPGDVLNDLE